MKRKPSNAPAPPDVDSLRPPMLDRVAAVRPRFLVAAAIAVHIALSLFDMSGESVTTDELVHLSAGYAYLAKGDFRLNPEHPPLVKLMAALPLRLMNVQWPSQDKFWVQAEEWDFGYQFFYQSGNDPDRLLFWGRVPMLVWGCVLLIAVHAVTLSLYGPRGGLIALALATFCPTLLAHGHLVTTDVPVATASFLSVIALWKFLRKPTVLRMIACGLSIGVATATKFSAIMFLPALALIGAVEWFRASKAPAEDSDSPMARSRTRTRLLWLGRLFCIGAIAFVFLWAVYGFRYRASSDPALNISWDFDPANHSMIAKCIDKARRHHFLPEAFLNGFRFMHEEAQARPSFAFGEYSNQGRWWYFPAAFLVKNPVPTLILMAWGTLAYLRRNRDGDSSDHVLIVPLIIYGVLAASSNINIGIRHIMPVYPFLFVLAGGIPLPGPGVSRAWNRSRLTAALLFLNAAGCLISLPHLLGYFHLPSLLIWRPHEMLSDSNLDWGQSLARLKRYMDQHGISEIKLAYFGNASPRHLGLRHERLPSHNMYLYFEPEWKEATHYRAGEYVAISAHSLLGVLWPKNHHYYLHRFGSLTPLDTIDGGAILLYQVPREWDGIAVDPSPDRRRPTSR